MSAAIAMAVSAGDKVKSSAQDFLRNLGEWKTQEDLPTTLETAFTKMFGSCTVGAGGGEELDRHGNVGVEMDVTLYPKAQRKNNQKNLVTPATFRSGRPIRADFGEQVYENLFMDDQQMEGAQPPSPPPTRKPSLQRAPDSARDAEPKETPVLVSENHRLRVQTSFPNSRDHPNKSQVGKVFPVSSPQWRSAVHAIEAKIPESASKAASPLGSDHLIVPNRTFDDTISAVSAQTLEAMARTDKIKHSLSNDSTLFPSSTRETSSINKEQQYQQHLKQQDLAQLDASSRGFGRKRSEQTHKSRSSKTTSTTDDSCSDHSKWVNGEQNYWEQEVNAQESPKSFKPIETKRAKSNTVRLL